ncbi:amidohydrolase [Mammaliicoccus lentus]|uniref:amidohydrolase n=1 Tax=Mammaliicoccus lentus TaxID=42858 RepID=UPI002649DDC3|nr:amidohydrolase family protein [Mammaliicoccus lentus]
MEISKIINANVLDMVDNKPYTATLYLKEGYIYKIITQDSIIKDNEALDLKGKWLTPGFIDTHSHPTAYGTTKTMVDCSASQVSNIDELVQKFKLEKNKLHKEGWLMGFGYNEKALEEQRHPNRFDLDQISEEIAICIMHYSGHMATVNTKALEYMGVNLNDSDPEGGYYGRDEHGKVNGVLIEIPAIAKLQRVLPEAKPEDTIYTMNLAVDDYIKSGITNTSDLLIGSRGYIDYEGVLKFLESPQRIRTRWMLSHELLEQSPNLKNVQADEIETTLNNISNGMAHLGGVKCFSDGSIQLQTASIRNKYLDGSVAPKPLMNNNKLIDTFKHFQKLGFNIVTHANGDFAAKAVIDAYKATATYKNTPLLNRIEHLQTVTQQDIKEMVDHNIGGSFFINHVYYFGDLHRDVLLGEDKAQNLNPLRWAEDARMTFTIHTDAPVTPISPLESIQIAVNRNTKQGKILGKGQRLTRSEAYKKMTVDAAKLNNTDAYEGSIKQGNVADFVILNQNPLDNEVVLNDDLIEMTICNGQIVHSI